MRLPCIMLAILGSVVALPQPTSRAESMRQLLSQPSSPRIAATIEAALWDVINELRDTMLNGSDDVPVLDPLEIEHIFVNDEVIPLPGVEITAKDVTVKNMATFVIHRLDVSRAAFILPWYRIQLDADIPRIDIDVGKYDLRVNAMGFDIFGKGDGQITVVQPRIELNIVITPRLTISGIFLNILECNIRFSLGDFQPRITGLFNDESVSAFVSLFLQNLVRELLDFYENDVNEFLSTTVHEIANDFLREFDVGSILG